MKTGLLSALLVTVLACVAQARKTPRTVATLPTLADSAAMFREAWYAVANEHGRLRAAWLWAPSAPDTAGVLAISPEMRTTGVFAFSPALRELLVQGGIPASTRYPAGDDTVVFRVTAWRTDSAGALLDFVSSWTTILRGPCRTGSTNIEQVRVRGINGVWTAERGPVIHGDRICAPIG